MKKEFAMHDLGLTRSSLKHDHLLQTPDTFIRTPLPGAQGVTFIVHAAPRIGAAFTMMTAEFGAGGILAPLLPGIQRFIYVLEGEVDVKNANGAPSDFETRRGKGQFSFFPADSPCHLVQAESAARAILIEKAWTSVAPDRSYNSVIEVLQGDESEVASEALGGDERLQVKRLIPDGEAWDFAVNTMTYEPGASLAMVEIHVMEHGLLMLEGGGIYRLGDSWYPVQAGDFIWMAPYCPQWFGAIGRKPAKYLIYKDWYRHPLAG